MFLKHLEVGESDYKCSFCEKGFIRLCDLNNHKQGHKGSLRKLNMSFKCKICSRQFVSINKLQDHQERHKEKPFVCQSCEFRTHSNSLLQSHAKIHTQEFSFTCNRCDKTFRHKNSLVLHERVHTGGKPYKCNTCNNTFSQSTHFLTHKRSVHSALTEECKVCKKKFQSSEYARKHEVSMHSNTKDFQCEKCMKMFKLSSHLKAHKAVHEKKSVCLQHVSKDLFIEGYFEETYWGDPSKYQKKLLHPLWWKIHPKRICYMPHKESSQWGICSKHWELSAMCSLS